MSLKEFFIEVKYELKLKCESCCSFLDEEELCPDANRDMPNVRFCLDDVLIMGSSTSSPLNPKVEEELVMVSVVEAEECLLFVCCRIEALLTEFEFTVSSESDSGITNG